MTRKPRIHVATHSQPRAIFHVAQAACCAGRPAAHGRAAVLSAAQAVFLRRQWLSCAPQAVDAAQVVCSTCKGLAQHTRIVGGRHRWRRYQYLRERKQSDNAGRSAGAPLRQQLLAVLVSAPATPELVTAAYRAAQSRTVNCYPQHGAGLLQRPQHTQQVQYSHSTGSACPSAFSTERSCYRAHRSSLACWMRCALPAAALGPLFTDARTPPSTRSATLSVLRSAKTCASRGHQHSGC